MHVLHSRPQWISMRFHLDWCVGDVCVCVFLLVCRLFLFFSWRAFCFAPCSRSHAILLVKICIVLSMHGVRMAGFGCASCTYVRESERNSWLECATDSFGRIHCMWCVRPHVCVRSRTTENFKWSCLWPPRLVCEQVRTRRAAAACMWVCNAAARVLFLTEYPFLYPYSFYLACLFWYGAALSSNSSPQPLSPRTPHSKRMQTIRDQTITKTSQNTVSTRNGGRQTWLPSEVFIMVVSRLSVRLDIWRACEQRHEYDLPATTWNIFGVSVCFRIFTN